MQKVIHNFCFFDMDSVKLSIKSVDKWIYARLYEFINL